MLKVKGHGVGAFPTQQQSSMLKREPGDAWSVGGYGGAVGNDPEVRKATDCLKGGPLETFPWQHSGGGALPCVRALSRRACHKGSAGRCSVCAPVKAHHSIQFAKDRDQVLVTLSAGLGPEHGKCLGNCRKKGVALEGWQEKRERQRTAPAEKGHTTKNTTNDCLPAHKRGSALTRFGPTGGAFIRANSSIKPPDHLEWEQKKTSRQSVLVPLRDSN
jgi:hypothetical protein